MAQNVTLYVDNSQFSDATPFDGTEIIRARTYVYIVTGQALELQVKFTEQGEGSGQLLVRYSSDNGATWSTNITGVVYDKATTDHSLPVLGTPDAVLETGEFLIGVFKSNDAGALATIDKMSLNII